MLRSTRLAGLAVARMPPAPLAVLAQRDALGVVALGLVGLIVAPLALLAREGDADAHVSGGHDPSSVVSPEGKRTPRRGWAGRPMVLPPMRRSLARRARARV